MNILDILIIVAVVIAVSIGIFVAVRDRKKGYCNGDCSSCGMNCKR